MELDLGFREVSTALPVRQREYEYGVRSVLVREYVPSCVEMATSATELFEQISDKALDVLEGFLIMAEALPTRGELIYHALNKPWESDNWLALAAGWRVTKRKLRKQRAELENFRHIQWARKLNTRKEFRAQ